MSIYLAYGLRRLCCTFKKESKRGVEGGVLLRKPKENLIREKIEIEKNTLLKYLSVL
jgi:hypothetical protein